MSNIILNVANTGELNLLTSINFTLHSEPIVYPPEFSISCRTSGGPARNAAWFWNGKFIVYNGVESQQIVVMEESLNHSVYIETSQTILDTTFKSVYESILFVRGRAGGELSCYIWNKFPHVIRNEKITIEGES